MNSNSFRPLPLAGLTGTPGSGQQESRNLVDGVTGVLVSENVVSTEGLQGTVGNGYYRRYMRICETEYFLTLCSRSYGGWDGIPLWLYVKGGEASFTPMIETALRSLGVAFPNSQDSSSKATYLPLLLPLGSDNDTFVRAIADQVRAVARVIM